MVFICYPKCSTCKKAQAWLKAQGLDCEVRDIQKDNPTLEELRQWHRQSGLPLKKFFNTSGQQYRALGLKDKLPAMTEEEQLALLATDGMLVKRPAAPTARCPAEGNLHLTLAFLGEVPPARLEDATAALEALSPRRLALRLSQIGQFPQEGGLWWLGPEPCPELSALREELIFQRGGCGTSRGSSAPT